MVGPGKQSLIARSLAIILIRRIRIIEILSIVIRETLLKMLSLTQTLTKLTVLLWKDCKRDRSVFTKIS